MCVITALHSKSILNLDMEEYLEKLLPALKNYIQESMLTSQGYTYYIGRAYPGHPLLIYTEPDRNTIYRNEIERLFPIDKLVNMLKGTFPRCHVFYDNINMAIRVRLELV
jgi:hypothetical protein